MPSTRARHLLGAVLLATGLAACGSPAAVSTSEVSAEPVLLPADSRGPAEPAELLPEPADLGKTWRTAEAAPAIEAGCSRAGSTLELPAEAVRRLLTDGSAYAEVAAWSSTDADAAQVVEAVRTGAYAPPEPSCGLTPRVVDLGVEPPVEPGIQDDRASEPLVRVEHVGADGEVAATEFLLAVQRGPVVAVAVLHGGGPFTQHDGAFAVQRAAIAGACSGVAQPGCEGPAMAGSGLLAPEALGAGWTAALPRDIQRPHSSLFCNGVGGYGWSGAIEHAHRLFTGPGGSTASQGLLAGVDASLSAELRNAARDRGVSTSMACAQTPERVEEVLVDEADEAAGTWTSAMRVTETLASGESATALLLGVGRGPVVGLLTARDDGAPVDPDRALAALRAGVCAVPGATGC